MTLVLPAASTFDGTSLNTDVGGTPRLISRIVRGLDSLPEVRGQNTVIPGAVGQVPRARVWNRLVIELDIWVLGTGSTEADQREDVRDALDTLTALFDPTSAPATLVAEMEDTTTRSIEARAINIVHDDAEVPTRRRLSVELEAVEGGWA